MPINHSPQSRRRFLAGTLATGAATAAMTRPSVAGMIASKTRIAILGSGGRGRELAKSFAKIDSCEIVAFADPDIKRAEGLAKQFGAKPFQDLRTVLDDKTIDAVVVATCNHWHCLATIWAIQAGKDVYVEKPLSHNQFEGAAVVRAAKENNRIVQIGTQQRSDPLQAQARDFLHGKKALGEIQFVVACRMGQRKPIGKKSQPIKIDSNVDYDLWCGPAEKRGLVRDKMHYDWHWDWNTGNGEMGNWGVHILDDVRNVAYQDSVTTPTAITAAGSRVAWDDAGNTPNLHVAVIETETFPTFMALSNLAAAPGEPKKGWSLRAELPQNLPGSGYAVVCDGGVYYGQRGSGRAVDSLGDTIKKFGEGKRDTVLMHARAFINAVQSRDASLLNAPIDQGHYSSGWCNLANVAVRAAAGNVDESIHEASDFGVWSLILDEMANQLAPFRVSPESIRFSQRLKHDPKTERFVGDGSSTANEFMTRSFRKGFVVS